MIRTQGLKVKEPEYRGAEIDLPGFYTPGTLVEHTPLDESVLGVEGDVPSVYGLQEDATERESLLPNPDRAERRFSTGAIGMAMSHPEREVAKNALGSWRSE